MTALPVIDAAREKKVSKPSLLAGLTKKLLPGKKAAKEPSVARAVVDPAPSVDPVDVLPNDDANELLEPGSGAPDVRKILERVRASQQATKTNANADTNGDRTDYIAAARRAAQAAAMEMDRAQKTSPTANKKTSDAKPKVKTPGDGTSLFARYRRPILMAVGAVLLAAMAMPLVNTLTRSEAPPAVEEVTPEQNSEAVPLEAPVEAVAQVDAPSEPVAAEPALELRVQNLPPMPRKIWPLSRMPRCRACRGRQCSARQRFDGTGVEWCRHTVARSASLGRRCHDARIDNCSAVGHLKGRRRRRNQAGDAGCRDRGPSRDHAAVAVDCSQERRSAWHSSKSAPATPKGVA